MTSPELRRHLGTTTAVMVTVGSVIGSGIFLKPLDIAQALPDVLSIYACWAGLGLVCLFGAFAYGELGAMLPEAGGQYAFLREGWGRFPAFLYGWCLLLVMNTGTLAALAVAFARNLTALVSLGEWGEISVAASMILLLAGVNHFGVRWGALLQNLSTFAKLAALGSLVLAGFVLAGSGEPAVSAPAVAPPRGGTLAGLVTACVAIFWAYEGWHQLPFNAAELKDPARSLPRGLIYGVLILIVTYVAVNAVYLHVVPLEEMRGFTNEVEVPRTAVDRIFGGQAGTWLVLLICLSIFGAGNPNLLSTPRGFYAMAQDGLVPRALMRIHPRHRTPTIAIWVQALWALILVVVLRTFRDITEYVIFASLIFYALTVAAVFVLRRRQPERPRPYRCLGYPLTPALFIAVVLLVDAITLMESEGQRNALMGLGILAAGVPAYFLMRRRAPGAGL